MIGSYVRRRDEIAFRMVASAVLERRALEFDYLARSTNERQPPQGLAAAADALPRQLVPGCLDHDREALRSFSVDRIQHRACRKRPRATFPTPNSTSTWRPSYGIFLGHAQGHGDDRVLAQGRALGRRRALAPKQEGRFLPDGRYQQVALRNAKELLMDVAALRRRCRNHRAGLPARTGEDAAATGRRRLRKIAFAGSERGAAHLPSRQSRRGCGDGEQGDGLDGGPAAGAGAVAAGHPWRNWRVLASSAGAPALPIGPAAWLVAALSPPWQWLTGTRWPGRGGGCSRRPAPVGRFRHPA